MQKVFVAYLIGKTFYHCLESKNVIVKQADRTVWLSPMATDLINAVTHSTDCSSIKFIDCSILIFFFTKPCSLFIWLKLLIVQMKIVD